MNYRVLLLGLLLILGSCYSFTGSSLDPRIETINISPFMNYASYQLPNYSQDFTNDLQLRFDQRTKLNLTNSNEADIIIEGEITEFYESPVNIGSNEQANQNRLTVQVRVNYINNVEEEKSFSRTFSEFIEYDANQTLLQIAPTITPQLNTIIIDKIFNAIVTDW